VREHPNRDIDASYYFITSIPIKARRCSIKWGHISPYLVKRAYVLVKL